MILELRKLYLRDLEAVKKEIVLFNNESDLWLVREGITNPSGNLVLHICGNLLHFFGATLGKTGYVRLREKEFNDKNVSKAELCTLVDETMEVVDKTLSQFTPADLYTNYPIPYKEEVISNGMFFFHLYGHLSYHLGQINYHRRLI